jgi:hypothetical protein
MQLGTTAVQRNLDALSRNSNEQQRDLRALALDFPDSAEFRYATRVASRAVRVAGDDTRPSPGRSRLPTGVE